MMEFDLFWFCFCWLFFVLLYDLKDLKNLVHRLEFVSLNIHLLVFLFSITSTNQVLMCRR